MEYHKDRFEDNSLLIFNTNELVAVLPANRSEDILISHQGLTYGGLILKQDLKLAEVIQGYHSILQYLYDHNIETLQIKAIPKIYHKLPSDELDYIAFITNAEMVRCDISSVILNSNKLQIESSNRKRGLKRAHKNELVIKEEDKFDIYWNSILIPNLKKRYQTSPTHSVDEIRLLKELFPLNIRQFNVYNKDKLVAGVTIFETDCVAHVQYISADDDKQELGSLDFAFHELITTIFKNKP